METEPRYRYLLSPRDLITLHEIADREWSAIAWSQVHRLAGLNLRCSLLRITAEEKVVTIGVRSCELESGVEAFRLTAGLTGEWPLPGWYKSPVFSDSDEIMSAFKGTDHRLFVGARRYAFESVYGEQSFLVEDLLLIRHDSGQQAFICADDSLPGSLFIARDRNSLPSPGTEFAYLRAL